MNGRIGFEIGGDEADEGKIHVCDRGSLFARVWRERTREWFAM